MHNTKRQIQNNDTLEFRFYALNLGSDFYGTVREYNGFSYVLVNINLLEHRTDSEFIGTCIHEMIETIVDELIIHILDRDTSKDKIPLRWFLKKYPQISGSIRNIGHFMVSCSLKQYLYLSRNNAFSSYFVSDKRAKI